jgi:Mn2+/Fe2+ NRAMP family transporter
MAQHAGSTLLGAMFLMATSAIGPGFITQTTAFTVELGAAFAFAIAVSILVDIALQLNVWRIIGVSGRRAQELGNLVLPGLGWAMAALLLLGGLVFNVGNVSGAGLGTDAMLGLDPRIGGALSALIAIGIFLSKRAGLAMDRVVVVLGLVMISLTTYVAVSSGPPVGQALRNTVLPESVSFLAITTLIGGTIGGYIVYAGAHRLLDSGVSGPERVRDITRGSVTGILITGVMRVILFLAILGVVSAGADLDPDSQAASAFEQAAVRSACASSGSSCGRRRSPA